MAGSIVNQCDHALEMAGEIKRQHERLYCLASAVTTQLAPNEGGESADIVALNLAELLEEMLSDIDQHGRLVVELTEMQSSLSEVAHG